MSDYEYDLSIAHDCHGTRSAVQYSELFYFGVEDFECGKTYIYNIKNTGKQVLCS